MACYPVYDASGLKWVIYAVVGIVVPLIVHCYIAFLLKAGKHHRSIPKKKN